MERIKIIIIFDRDRLLQDDVPGIYFSLEEETGEAGFFLAVN